MGADEKKQMGTDISDDICANLASFNLCPSVQVQPLFILQGIIRSQYEMGKGKTIF
jgi:hypothetical protein